MVLGAERGYTRAYQLVSAPGSGVSHFRAEVRDLVWQFLARDGPQLTWDQEYEQGYQVQTPTTVCGRPVRGPSTYPTIRLCRACLDADLAAIIDGLEEQLLARWLSHGPARPRDQARAAWQAHWEGFSRRPVQWLAPVPGVHTLELIPPVR
jgi:hypothetical protein